MAAVMKQLNRSDEAIEAIKSFCHLCLYDSQESLDSVLIEPYKRSGKIAEAIEMLQCKLKKIEECIAFGYDEGSLKCVSSGPVATSQFSPLSVFDNNWRKHMYLENQDGRSGFAGTMKEHWASS